MVRRTTPGRPKPASRRGTPAATAGVRGTVGPESAGMRHMRPWRTLEKKQDQGRRYIEP